MTTRKADNAVVDPDSPQRKAWIEKPERELEEGKARVRKVGGTSFEGFYIEEDGKPQSIGKDD